MKSISFKDVTIMDNIDVDDSDSDDEPDTLDLFRILKPWQQKLILELIVKCEVGDDDLISFIGDAICLISPEVFEDPFRWGKK